MNMFNTNDILETIKMIDEEHLDIRTVTMGISLLDCINPDIDVACNNVYEKITCENGREGKRNTDSKEIAVFKTCC